MPVSAFCAAASLFWAGSRPPSTRHWLSVGLTHLKYQIPTIKKLCSTCSKILQFHRKIPLFFCLQDGTGSSAAQIPRRVCKQVHERFLQAESKFQ